MLSLVSVIIPMYNRESTIQRAVDSVLSQTYTNIEVLIVDDASTDNSVRMLDKYKHDSRVKLLCQTTNQGANAARNRGIREAKGEYIAFHDSDDEWLPQKLEKQLRYMEEENFDISFCAFKRHYTEAVQIIPDISQELSSEEIREKLKRGNIIGTPALVVHRKVVQTVGVFDEEMPRLQDYEYAIRIAKEYDIGFLNEVLLNEYELEGCISSNPKSMKCAYALLLKKHADFIDVDYIWNEYLRIANIMESFDIDWENFDEIINDITKENKYCTKERLYKATLQRQNTRYIRIKEHQQHKYHILLDNLKNKKFVIYGAGHFARQLAASLREEGLVPECFLVTQNDGTDNIGKIPVIPLSGWNDKETVVIVAVSGEAQQKIIENLEKYGMNNYDIYPECI